MKQPQGQRSILLLLAAVAIVVLVLGAGSTNAAGGHRHGGHHHRVHAPKGFLGVLPGPTPFDETDAAKIARTNIRTARMGLLWNTVQRQRGPFDWRTSDRLIARLAENGVGVLPTLAGSPSWVENKGTTAPVTGPGVEDAWKTFVTAVVRRYGPGGVFWRPDRNGRIPFHNECRCGAPPVPITTYQIWNEPNLKKYFTPKPSPNKYAELVKISRAAIDVADPDAKLVLAGLSDGGNPGKPGAIPFLKQLYRQPRIKQSFDAVGIHPYARNLTNLRRVMTRFRKVIKQRHDKRTPLWVTEIGWGSGHPNRYGHNKGIRGQAHLLKKSMTMMLENRKKWHVGHAYWFFWRDPPKSSTHSACSFCKSAGLLKNNGRPKPSYRAYRRLAKSR